LKYLLSSLIGQLATSTRWLCPHSRPEKGALATAIVGEVRDANSLRVQDLDAAAAHIVAALGEGSAQLGHRWLELLGDVDIPKVVLTAQIVDRQPFDFGYLFSIRQGQGEVLVVIAIQNVGSTVKKFVIYVQQFNKYILRYM